MSYSRLCSQTRTIQYSTGEAPGNGNPTCGISYVHNVGIMSIRVSNSYRLKDSSEFWHFLFIYRLVIFCTDTVFTLCKNSLESNLCSGWVYIVIVIRHTVQKSTWSKRGRSWKRRGCRARPAHAWHKNMAMTSFHLEQEQDLLSQSERNRLPKSALQHVSYFLIGHFIICSYLLIVVVFTSFFPSHTSPLCFPVQVPSPSFMVIWLRSAWSQARRRPKAVARKLSARWVRLAGPKKASVSWWMPVWMWRASTFRTGITRVMVLASSVFVKLPLKSLGTLPVSDVMSGKWNLRVVVEKIQSYMI